jgi:TonB family protein
MFPLEPRTEWLKKTAIFIISIIIHGIVLIILIQALTPVTIINFPVSVTPVVIVPREGLLLPSPMAGKAVPSTKGPVSGGMAGKETSKPPPSLEERLGLLGEEPALPSAGTRPPGPMPLPPFNLKPKAASGTSGFTLTLPAPPEKKGERAGKEGPRPGSAHDYWRYVLATEPGKEKKKGEAGPGVIGGAYGGASQIPKVVIEGPGYDLSPWAQEVVSRLQKNWQIAASRAPLEKGTLRLQVSVDKNGEISFMRIVNSSQKASFDRAALEAVNLSLPLPRFPAAIPFDSLELIIIFECEESRG